MITGVVFTALKGLVNNRCFENMLPPGVTPVWPAIIYTMVSAQPGPTVCGTDLGETDDSRVQIDFVALTAGAASVLRDAGMAALENVDPPAVRDGMFNDSDSVTRTHRASVDYLFHPSSQ